LDETHVSKSFDPLCQVLHHLIIQYPAGWMDGWMDGWIDGWMDEWMDEWMDG